jgi:hypothetical protein
MKTLRILSITTCLLMAVNVSFAQAKTETFKVSGNCGMCKSKIEKAAKAAGATSAEWNKETKMITVSFNSSSTSTAKIQKKIAAVGYDNEGAVAPQESYDKLHGCCKYERASTNTAKAECCKEGQCSNCEDCKDCCKDGKCTKDGDCCKDGKCANAKDGEGCCKEGTCTKEGHKGADCCKKSD